ncbi:uncharacterized protein FFB20_00840 [Fusarium fujikuroi]|nr:uncharacterized protein FFB20_00840 [Fusarium fujikuroi]SCN70614.1 uncharacterized protein FFE2_02055 [Fusarium fujikuroi]SCO14552.1 uncharacterized protein FFM5_10881 [Fusarium fujikuroi]SCV54683.1 uncharacterized protein FFFS_11389 [Fusarium fujikuroi]
MAVEEVHPMSLTTKTTSWLESLPTEVLHSICAQFCKITVVYAEPAQDLCALSRVSHRLRDVAQPVLYHEFPNFEHRERRLEPFLDTVTFRTDLARAVKVMAWNSNLANDLDIVRAQTGYHQGLKALGIDENQLWPDDECDMFLSPSALKVYGVNSIKLRELLATDLPHVILDVAPDLNHLVIGHFNPRNIYSPGSSKKPRTIGYLMSEQDFKLEEASPYRLDTRDLEKILTSRGQPLRRFRFETSRIKTKVDVPRISFSYLDNFCTTLESLHLEYDVDARLFGSTIRSLKKFTSLKEIFITANLIYSIREDDDPTRDAKSLVNFLPDQIEIFTEIDWTAPPFEHQPLARGFDGMSQNVGERLERYIVK